MGRGALYRDTILPEIKSLREFLKTARKKNVDLVKSKPVFDSSIFPVPNVVVCTWKMTPYSSVQ